MTPIYVNFDVLALVGKVPRERNMSSKLDYLQRYMSKDADKAKMKRKKQKKESSGNGVRVVDEDVSWEEIAPKTETTEEKWQLDDERPVIVNEHGEDPSDLPVVVNADEFRHELGGHNKSLAKLDDDYSPPRKARRGREESKTTRRHGHGVDNTSPPRKSRTKSTKEDASPPRKPRRQLNETSDTDPGARRLPERNICHSDERDASPPRRRPNNSARDTGDVSPPRRRRVPESDEEKSPPRRPQPSKSLNCKEEDSSPPGRRKEREDASPPRRQESRRRREKNSRSRSKSRGSYRRSERRSRGRSERRDSCRDRRRLSRSRSRDSRRRRSRSDSRARRSKRSRSPSAEKHEHNVEAVKKETTPPSSSTTIHEEKPKEKKKKAGLYTADQFVAEHERITRAKDMLHGADPSQMGANAETVYRDKKGRKLDMLNEMIRQQEILEGKRKREAKEEYEWGTGQVQKEEKRSQQELLEAMKSKPFARHEDDEELEKIRRDRVRDFDPMNSKVFQDTNDDLLGRKGKKKSKKSKSKDNKKSKPKYSGPPAPPNRFGIQPGYRWDGVVRGNGWEEKVLLKQNANTAQSEEQYKYAVADM